MTNVRVVWKGTSAGTTVQHDGRATIGVAVYLIVYAVHWGHLQVATLVGAK